MSSSSLAESLQTFNEHEIDVMRRFKDLQRVSLILQQDIELCNELIASMAFQKLCENNQGWCTNCGNISQNSALSLLYIEGARRLGKGTIKDVRELHNLCLSCRKRALSFDPRQGTRWLAWDTLQAFPVFDEQFINKDGRRTLIPASVDKFNQATHIPLRTLAQLQLPSFKHLSLPQITYEGEKRVNRKCDGPRLVSS
jgi:hypothetical protein